MKQIALLFTFLSLCVFLGIHSINAQSASLEAVTDIINNGNIGAPGVTHSVSFKLPQNSLSITPTDYIHITLNDGFSNVTAPGSLVGQYSGTPSFSVDGNTASVTGIILLPERTLTIDGITADNPGSTNNFTFTIAITEDEAGTLIKNYATGTVTDELGTVTMSMEISNPQAIIQISGFTAPQTFISFTEGANVIGTDLSSSLGYFSKYFPAMQPGSHEISLYGVDSESRSTSIVPLTINAPVYQTTTVSNILISPTLEISSTSITQGSDLYATGSAFPGTLITIFTDTPLRTYTASTSAAGAWTTTITDTEDYVPGDYRLYTMAQTTGGIQSLASHTQVFSIISGSSSSSGTACGDISQGDLNCDGETDLTDFSVLMFYWATTNAAADINSDGLVDLTDFSILMFYWGA